MDQEDNRTQIEKQILDTEFSAQSIVTSKEAKRNEHRKSEAIAHKMLFQRTPVDLGSGSQPIVSRRSHETVGIERSIRCPCEYLMSSIGHGWPRKSRRDSSRAEKGCCVRRPRHVTVRISISGSIFNTIIVSPLGM
ncbi:hypothetical protein PABG_02363 [Paracoccidioides brasiliensis Pb03]|nr:hypothetical protein PABG_02363 [Paracoccidioides brasiliensis Pb03]